MVLCEFRQKKIRSNINMFCFPALFPALTPQKKKKKKSAEHPKLTLRDSNRAKLNQDVNLLLCGWARVVLNGLTDLGFKAEPRRTHEMSGVARGSKSSPGFAQGIVTPGCTGDWPQNWKWRPGLPAHRPHQQGFTEELGFRLFFLFLKPGSF